VRNTNYKSSPYTVFASLLLPRPSQTQVPSSTPYSRTPLIKLRFSLSVTDQVSHPYKTTDKITVLFILILLLVHYSYC